MHQEEQQLLVNAYYTNNLNILNFAKSGSYKPSDFCFDPVTVNNGLRVARNSLVRAWATRLSAAGLKERQSVACIKFMIMT